MVRPEQAWEIEHLGRTPAARKSDLLSEAEIPMKRPSILAPERFSRINPRSRNPLIQRNPAKPGSVQILAQSQNSYVR